MKFERSRGRFNYIVEYIDKDDEYNIEVFRCTLNVKGTDKEEVLICGLDYGVEEKMIVSFCIFNQEDMDRDSLDMGYLYFNLLESELKEVIRFMLDMF